jgi:hypothetical protein
VAKKSSTAHGRSRTHGKAGRRWSHTVNTDSTHPSEGLFNKDARTIARQMASKKVSPKGIGSGIRMIQFFINRAGKSLSPSRRRVLERAKHLLQARLHKGATA